MTTDSARIAGILSELDNLHAQDFWGKIKNLPENLSSDLTELVQFYQTADSAARAQVNASLTPNSSFLFFGYASEMAVRAVRECNPDLISMGLAALAIENGLFDARENIIVMCLLCYSALKLQVDPQPLFLNASALATHPRLVTELRNFPSRPPAARSLKAFYFAETGSGETFDYVGTN
ncbi:MAG TPA: hypothetical protein VGI16_08115 [Candidatus Acidoferrum sp.]|jgi:hypothetical protein